MAARAAAAGAAAVETQEPAAARGSPLSAERRVGALAAAGEGPAPAGGVSIASRGGDRYRSKDQLNGGQRGVHRGGGGAREGEPAQPEAWKKGRQESWGTNISQGPRSPGRLNRGRGRAPARRRAGDGEIVAAGAA